MLLKNDSMLSMIQNGGLVTRPLWRNRMRHINVQVATARCLQCT
jgi:hypothetical protein